nr:phage minor capsid protein [uncultured Anaerostipes sp.]
MNEYDIQEALKRIEDELIASMIRNMDRHRAEETKEGFEWGMWQAEQLKALEEYKKRNKERYKDQFGEINSSIPALISESRKRGYLDQEAQILESIGKSSSRGQGDIDGSFFQINDRKMNALIDATVSDMDSAETAMLRRANDQYRKTIFNAQVYANSGVGTYEKAVDMATKDFLAAGIQCIQYKNGSMHRIEEYAGMAIRTASKRAYLTGEGEKRKEWGCHLVIMNKRGNPCPKCLPFVGKILIDDVWSGGSSKDGSYPLMSSAMAAGLYHPNCKDSHTTYFPGISTPQDDKFSKKEIKQVEEDYKDDQKQQYAQRQEEKFGRLANYSLDPMNKKAYAARQDQWKHVRMRTGNKSSQEYAESKRPLANFMALPQNRVVDVLRKESVSWIESLSGKEKHAIEKYTYNSGDRKPNRFYERLNGMLRGDMPKDEKLEEYADTISAALKKNVLQQDVIAYRGMDIDPSNNIPINGLYRGKQFFSTSVIENRSFDSKYKIIIYVKKGSKAAYIEKLSHYTKQRELLLDKDCIYRVLSRKENVIELEVI